MDVLIAGAAFPAVPCGEDIFVCIYLAAGAGFSTVCFSTVFLVISTFTGIMTHELEEVLYINYTNR